MSEFTMSRRDMFKLAGVATTAAVGASLLGCSSAEAAPAKDVTKAAAGVTSITLEQANSENVITITEFPNPTISLVEGIVYKQIVSGSSVQALHLDLLIPAGEGLKPLVVFIPGGGFTGSNPQGSITQRMMLAQAGYVVASVQHRVVPGVRFPGPVEDVKAAVRWLRANAATYSIDPEKVAAMGNSSGGYFATMLGVTADIDAFDTGDNLDQSSAVSAVIDLYGVSDLTIIGAGLAPELEEGHDSPATTEAMLINGTAFGNNKGASAFDTPETAAEASPFTYIDGTDPAFLIFHGDQDTLVSPVASAALAEQLRAVNVPVERYTIAGAGHGGPLFDQPEVVGKMIEFLDTYVKGAAEEA